MEPALISEKWNSPMLSSGSALQSVLYIQYIRECGKRICEFQHIFCWNLADKIGKSHPTEWVLLLKQKTQSKARQNARKFLKKNFSFLFQIYVNGSMVCNYSEKQRKHLDWKLIKMQHFYANLNDLLHCLLYYNEINAFKLTEGVRVKNEEWIECEWSVCVCGTVLASASSHLNMKCATLW